MDSQQAHKTSLKFLTKKLIREINDAVSQATVWGQRKGRMEVEE